MANKRKHGKREPNGRVSRAKADEAKRNEAHLAGLERDERDALSVGLTARQRVWGIPAAISRDQMAGSAIGRYCLGGQITRTQFDAAMSYLDEREHYLHAINAPRLPGAVDLNATHGQSVAAENVTRTRAYVAAMKATDAAIMDKQVEIGNMGNLFGALNAVLVMDTAGDHLLGDLRIALNALARRYKMEERRAA